MDPILFEIGPIVIRYYGVMYVVNIFVAIYLVRIEAKRKGLEMTDDDVTNFVVWSVLAAILGARIYSVLFNLNYYLAYPGEIPAIWHGGLAIHGGIIMGFLFSVIYLKKYGIPLWKMADSAAAAMVLGQGLGRFGNFMNGDAHGVPTDLPWGIVFPPESIAGREFPGIPLHPAMLYEMAINISIFAFLWFYLKRKDHKDGFIFASYIGLYSVGRFFVEYFRADSLMMGPLKAAQVVSITLVVAMAAVIIWKKLWTKKG